MAELIINSNCNGCGGCETSGYVKELENGMFEAKDNLCLDSLDIERLQGLIKECPCQAMELKGEAERTMSKDEVIADAIRRLESLEGISKINLDDVEFKIDDYYIYEIKRPYGDFEYSYHSYDKAKDAARHVFSDIMWAHTESLMQDVAVQYKCRILAKYYDMNDEDNIFLAANGKFNQILEETVERLKRYNIGNEQIPALCNINIKLDEFDINYLAEDHFVNQAVTRGMTKYGDKKYNFADNYGFKIDIDHMEVYETGIFGRDKLVTRYAYRGLDECCEKLSYDIRASLRHAKIHWLARDHVNSMIDHYNEMLQEEIKKKIEFLKSL